jgi:signal transduction histidine kinase/ligand-binding sensor domain-containing protein
MDPNRAMSQYVHDRWGAEQGFPAGPVYAIAQTTDGYLWIGTEAGLVRFDGWNFRLIKDESGAFTVASVLGLVADSNGSLWVRLQDLSIIRYHNGAFDRPATDPEEYTHIETMARTNRGELLVSRMQTGVFVFRNGRFQKLAPATGLPRSPVTSLSEGRDGDVWLGTRDAGLFHFTRGGMAAFRNGLPDPKVNSMLAGANQELWIGTDAGVVRWNGTQITSGGIPQTVSHFQALLMVRDRDENVWVGTDSQGLLRLNSQGFASLPRGDYEPTQAITALFEDREGNLWIGHAGGIERLRDSAFVSYSNPEGLPADGSNPIFVDGHGRTWFAPVNGGLWWIQAGLHGRILNADLNQDVVYSIAGGDGDLWLGRQRGGLTRVSLETGRELKTYTQADGLAQNSVYSVYRSPDGTIWAGTLSAGASMLRDGQFTNYTSDTGLASNTVVSMLETNDGVMWFATPGGLSALSKGRWRSYGASDGLPSPNVNCLFQDASGILWAGTSSGIAFRSAGAFKNPAHPPAALQAQVLGIAEDRFGSFWIATSNHVLRANRQKLLEGTLGESDLQQYGLADGLRGVEGVKRHRSVDTDAAGRIWFSLNRGISVVDPSRLTRNSAPVIAHVQSVSADGVAIRVANDIHIPGGRQRITFGFAGLSLSASDRVRYRYLLEGFDPAWSDPGSLREAGYTKLGPGSYRFRLMAAGPDGVWSPWQDSLSFRVDPLFWQTWWFVMALAATCAVAILLFYRFRMRQLASRLNLRFEERLAERTRIAQELHDTLLQGFLSASMQLHVAVDTLPADSPARPTLTRALQLMRQVIDEGRNAVRGLRSTAGESFDLENVFSRVPEEVVPQGKGGEQVRFRVIVDGARQPLHPLLRDDIYRIGREALINAFRHAQAKKIEVELQYSPNRLRVLVRDDGRGIEPQILASGRDGHWGLPGMRERAEQIGARLQVYSSAMAGTEVELSIPGHVAFEHHHRRGLAWFIKWRTPRNGNGKGNSE